MKVKCSKCGVGKARRSCAREGNAEICSECCASIRDADCGDCVHYAATLQYEEKCRVSAALSDGHFMMELNEEVQNAVSDALDMAQRGKTRKALAVLTGLLPDHPLHHDIPYGIGVVHAVKGEYEESIKWFDRALQIDPDYQPALSNRKVVDQMEEGRPLENTEFKSVNHALTNFLKKRK